MENYLINKKMKRAIFLFAIVILNVTLISRCTFSSGSGPNNNDQTIPHNPQPANNSINQNLALTLSWQAQKADRFDVYFDTNNPPKILKASNVGTNASIVVTNLNYSTRYFWKVISKFNDGTSKAGPVWSFVTKAHSGIARGYILVERLLKTELPDIVNLLFQVQDFNEKGIDFLTTLDFELFEDGQKVSKSESSFKILKKNQVPYTFNTILMLDNSTSLAPNIQEIKSAAITFVNNLMPKQKVAIYKFSEKPVLLQDFTDNIALLTNAINSLTVGYATTDLYGAVITGASKMKEEFSVNNIVESAMVLFTDGKDTQDSHTIAEATSAVQGKRVYTVGLGSEIDPEVLTMLGTSGFFPINDVNQLTNIFLQIEDELNKDANSFYWMRYRTPKRGPYDHTLRLSIINNPNSGNGSFISDHFNSSGFFSISPGVYINSTSSNPDGIDTLFLSRTTGAQIVVATSYYMDSTPKFSWTVPDTSIAKIKLFLSDSSRAQITPGNKTGLTSTLVTDVNNAGASKRLYIRVR